MTVALVVNFHKKNSLETAEKCIGILSEFASIIADEETVRAIGNEKIKVSENIFAECDICIIIGGDGTILHNAKRAAAFLKPVLGINTGRIGYLASLEPSEIAMLSRLADNSYCIEERIMLDVLHSSSKGDNTYTAFNDAIISKGSLSRMIDIEVLTFNKKVKYRSDGLIFSTPTGSTAYSMSAGGPIIYPEAENIVLTPICPYSDFSRSLVLPSAVESTVMVDLKDRREAYLGIDGEIAIEIKRGDSIVISQSETRVKLINFGTNFLRNCVKTATGGY